MSHQNQVSNFPHGLLLRTNYLQPPFLTTRPSFCSGRGLSTGRKGQKPRRTLYQLVCEGGGWGGITPAVEGISHKTKEDFGTFFYPSVKAPEILKSTVKLMMTSSSRPTQGLCVNGMQRWGSPRQRGILDRHPSKPGWKIPSPAGAERHHQHHPEESLL